ncbi:MAG: hypothetical protein WB421_17280, partial [Terriglobales bacterium]
SVVCLRGSLDAYRYHLAICGSDIADYHHVSFELADVGEVVRAEESLFNRGIAVEKSVDHSSKRSFFLIDPDGMRIEFYARRIPEFVDLSDEPAALVPFLI